MNRFSARTIAFAGVLTAMNVVLTRLISIPVGNILRISVGAVPVILSGLWLGPVTGAVCGGLGDLIGCAVGGYAPNPFISFSACLTGVLPALFRPFLLKRKPGFPRFLGFVLILALTMLLTSQGFTTLGLSLLYGMPFKAAWLSRLPQSAVLCLADAFICEMLFSRMRLPGE